MSNTRPYIIVAIVALIVFLIFAQLAKVEEEINWEEDYSEGSLDPYGVLVINELLRNYFPDQTYYEISEGLSSELKTGEVANYVFIGEAQYLDSSDVSQLLDFVSKGSNAFIISKTVDFDLMDQVYFESCNGRAWDEFESVFESGIKLSLDHPVLKPDSSFSFNYYNLYRKRPYFWHYLDSVYFCEKSFSFVPLGTFDEDKINFARVAFGNGHFYFHTNPLVFTNIHLVEAHGSTYASRVFSHLVEGPIYWDNYSRVPEFIGKIQNSGSADGPQQTPLSYVLSQPSLAWAWYLSLVLALLYLLFRAKRKQRIIPVLETNNNTSLEFISTIGSLYFIQNDHRKLSLQKLRLFQAFVRDRYHIPTKVMDQEFTEKLTAKSEVHKSIIDRIVLFQKNIYSSNFVSEKTLIDLHQVIDQFYKNCK